MTIKRRAITDEQRIERRQTLLKATWNLFQKHTYEEINISDVATEAGLAKGTVYLYFKTKEELFLAVQGQQLGAWFDDLDRRLQEQVGSGDAGQVAALICSSLTEHPAMARLFAILHPVLEQNVEYEVALKFKRMLLERITKIGALVEANLPYLAPGQGVQLALWAYTVTLGLQQLVNPAPVIRLILANEPDLAPFALDFCGECRAMLTAMFLGVKSH